MGTPSKKRATSAASSTLRSLLVAVGSTGATFGLFVLLPLINKFAESPPPDTQLIAVDSLDLQDEPEVVEEEEPEPEPEEEPEPPPELNEPVQELSLAELELALAPSVGIGDSGGARFEFDLKSALGASGGGMDELFSAADLDNKPEPINPQPPKLNEREKKATPGQASVIFVVDERGRVTLPKVQKAAHPDLGAAALRTVKKWRFEPGTRKGKAVSFRVRQVFSFPKQ